MRNTEYFLLTFYLSKIPAENKDFFDQGLKNIFPFKKNFPSFFFKILDICYLHNIHNLLFFFITTSLACVFLISQSVSFIIMRNSHWTLKKICLFPMYYNLEQLLEPVSYLNQFVSFIFIIYKKLKKSFNGIIQKPHSHDILAHFCLSGCTFHILYYLICLSSHLHLRGLIKIFNFQLYYQKLFLYTLTVPKHWG